ATCHPRPEDARAVARLLADPDREALAAQHGWQRPEGDRERRRSTDHRARDPPAREKARTGTARLGDRLAHRVDGGSRGAVEPIEAGLEAGELGIVDEAEEIDRGDGGLTDHHPHELAVDERLRPLVRHWHVLGTGVAGDAGRVDLPADLVE